MAGDYYSQLLSWLFSIILCQKLFTKLFLPSNLLKANFRDKKFFSKSHWEFLKPQNNDIQITKGDQEAKQVLRVSLHPSHHLCKPLDGQSGTWKDETKRHDESTLSHEIILIIKGKHISLKLFFNSSTNKELILSVIYCYHFRRRSWQLTPVFLPGEFHGQRSLASYSP